MSESLADVLRALDVPIRFWACPIREHAERHDTVTVEWRDDVAYCTATGCLNTSADMEQLATELRDIDLERQRDRGDTIQSADTPRWIAYDVLGSTWLTARELLAQAAELERQANRIEMLVTTHGGGLPHGHCGYCVRCETWRVLAADIRRAAAARRSLAATGGRR